MWKGKGERVVHTVTATFRRAERRSSREAVGMKKACWPWAVTMDADTENDAAKPPLIQHKIAQSIESNIIQISLAPCFCFPRLRSSTLHLCCSAARFSLGTSQCVCGGGLVLVDLLASLA